MHDEFPLVTRAIEASRVMPGALETVKRLADSPHWNPVQRDALKAVLEHREGMQRALLKIIKMNRRHALDQFGDPEMAERWACVTVAREALGKERH